MDIVVPNNGFVTVTVAISKFLFNLAYSLFNMDIVIGSKLNKISIDFSFKLCAFFPVTKLCVCAAVIVACLRYIRK